MKLVSELHFRMCDHGLFLPMARRLARDAKKVSYWTPSEKAFPTVRDCIGEGFSDIERVECYLQDLDDVDCFVFPDIGFSKIQTDLRYNTDIPVWGAQNGDELEIDRGIFLDTLKEVGLPVPKHEKVTGITALREALFPVKDKWVKISKYRGDWETFHWRSREEDENALDHYAVSFGPFREVVVFYVFDPIDADIEDGCDTWCIEGKFPELIVHGMECKDKAYIGTWQHYEDQPQELRKVLEAFGPVLANYGYRSFFSIEVRITKDGDSYFIDPTCRAGSPPSQVTAEMIGNLGEIIWAGANGEMVQPEPAAKFGAQAVCCFKRDEEAWTYVKLPDDLDRWVKSCNCMSQDGMLCLPPGHQHTGCEDWLTGIGDTMDEAIRHLQRNAKLLPDGATCDVSHLADLLKEIKEAEEQGMEFSDQQIPDPKIVVER